MGLNGLEDRSVFQLEPDPEPESDQHGRDQEGDAPPEADELLFGQGEGQDGQRAVRHEVAGGRAHLGGGCPEAAPVGIPVFAGEQHGAAPFAAYAHALGEAQQHQDDRGGDADAAVAGERADQYGGHADDHEGGDQDLLAADPVAEPAEDDAAHGAGNVAHSVG
ncbi:hypothetical protein D9M72_454600 [compost metagenome]